jgi:enoyl-CoA hydratase/carnithine racemase
MGPEPVPPGNARKADIMERGPMPEAHQYRYVSWAQDGEIAVITLNRPGQMNAISPELEEELHAALHSADRDPAIRAVVLTGAGNAFSAGYDISDDNPPVEGPAERASDRLGRWWDVDMSGPARQLTIMRLGIPVIAAVNGWCLGGGMWYALCCDITIAATTAVFGQPEVRENQNSTFLLAALAGWKHAHRYALTGDHFDAAEALRIGIVNEVVPPDQLITTATALAERIARLPAASIRVNKAITTFGLEAMGLAAALNTGALLSVIVHASADSAELDELHRIRESEGLRASLVHRDAPFRPEPGGPRSRAARS